jgi:aspartate aminotransferase/aminotransferase
MSDVFSKLRPAKSIEINQSVYEMKRLGERIITLSLGEAYFDIPDFGFSRINHDIGYHYCDTRGLPELRAKIAEYYYRYHDNLPISDTSIIVSAGSKILTYQTMKMVLAEGDNIILHEPAWLSYQDQATLCGASTTYLPYDQSLSDISKYVSEKTKLIIVNNPNNPAGYVYKKEELRGLLEFAQSNDIFVLVDEAYCDFVYPESQSDFCSAASYISEFPNLVVVSSISKNFGMSGWRIGYAISNSSNINKLEILNQHTITCAPTALQLYLSEHLFDVYDACYPQIQKLLTKRKKVEDILRKYEVPFISGSATFYLFVDIRSSVMNSDQFADTLLTEHKVAVVPGSAYGETTSGFIRLSIGTEPLSDVERAITYISGYLK